MSIDPGTKWIAFIDQDPPRDGRPLQLCAIDHAGHVTDHYYMRWEKDAVNPLIPWVIGFWMSLDNSFTWCDRTEGGPTHWAYLKVN